MELQDIQLQMTDESVNTEGETCVALSKAAPIKDEEPKSKLSSGKKDKPTTMDELKEEIEMVGLFCCI